MTWRLAALGPEELQALLDKYLELQRLRQTLSPDVEPPREDLRALASRFPGALRELDQLPPAELQGRIDALGEALGGGPVQTWMRALHGYHAWMRLALGLRLACARERTEARAREWLEGLDGSLGHPLPPGPLTPELLQAILSPPGGRLCPLILAQVAAELGCEPGLVRAWVRGP